MDYAIESRAVGLKLCEDAIALDGQGRTLEAVKKYREAAVKLMLAADGVPGSAITAESRDSCRVHSRKCGARADELVEILRKEGKPTMSKPFKQIQPKTPACSKQSDDGRDSLRDVISQTILVERPNVRWEDIAGLDLAKAELHKAVILPALMPHLYAEGSGREPWRGILLYGPPGTGKGMLAKAVATHLEGTFLSVSSSDLMSKWLGESENLVKVLFEEARRLASPKEPCVIFIDEIDSLLSRRKDDEHDATRRVKTEFLAQWDGVGRGMKGILVLAATNCPWDLDVATLRRFECKIFIDLPTSEARRELLRLRLGRMINSLVSSDLEFLVAHTEGFSGADLDTLCRTAAYGPVDHFQRAVRFVRECGQSGSPTIRVARAGDPADRVFESCWQKFSQQDRDLVVLDPIAAIDFQAALSRVKPTVSQESMVRFEEWTSKFGASGSTY